MKSLKINLYVLKSCNYRCRYCFVRFDDNQTLSVQLWKTIVDRCIAVLPVSEFNIAGGEPMLYPYLPELAEYIQGQNCGCSLITNGSLLTRDWIQKNAGYFSMIGFSIDSFNPEILSKIGRKTSSEKYISEKDFRNLVQEIKTANPNCKIKINTVVSSLNKDEIVGSLDIFQSRLINRWKILKMRVFESDVFSNADLAISDQEFERYFQRNMPGEPLISDGIIHIFPDNLIVVKESDLQSAYIVVDNCGNLVDNSIDGRYTPIVNCLTGDILEGFRKLHLNIDLYHSGYSF